ncbi:PREDICTED: glycine N-acyltransferase isoform X3 [Bison bison bison]|uniref:Glycine N-acyltransferase-like protein n=1 Tax=Bison bison bison TaxID=43346 RepID=A0A6P3GXR6_BISBB|nr:PREDICTED: glycine N-acyltransferase isoform X3 [Bison bison bison]
MTDDLDHYTNTYQVYSKDPKKCQEFLGSPEVINWKQHLQIQSSQSSLDDVIKNLAATKSGKVKQTQCFLYMASESGKKLATSLLEAKNVSGDGGKHKPRTLHIAVWHQGTEAEFQQHCPRKRYQRCFCQDFPAGHVIKSPPCNAGAIGLMPGQGTMIPHAKRQLSLHGTARERLHAPSGRAHTSNQESRCQEEPTHPTKSPDIRKSPHITKETQLSQEQNCSCRLKYQ